MNRGVFRQYLLSLVIPLGVLTLAAGVLQTWSTLRSTLRQVEITQLAQAQLAAARIAALEEGTEAMVRDFAALPWGSAFLDGRDREAEMRRLLKVAPAIRELAVVEGGQARVASRLDALRVRAADPPMLEFANAVLASKSSRSPVRIEAGGVPVVALGVPDAGPGGGVTIASIDLRFASDVVRAMGKSGDSAVSLVDARGRILAHADATHVLSGRERPELATFIAQAPAGQAWGRAASSLSGGDVYMSVAPVRGLGAWAVVEQDASAALAPVRGALVQAVLLVLLGIAAGAATSVLLARRLAGPIVALRARASRIGRGDFQGGSAVSGPSEIEDLDRELGHMAGQLAEYTTGLERKVSEKTAQLELANRHKSEFLANMSHELRTPLNAVIGFSDALRERMFGDLNAKQMEYVQDIHASGQHLLSLINDILDLSKVEAGRMELDLAEFDVAQALENARTLIRERAQRRGLRLAFAAGAGLGTWVADERKFKQVMLNLLSNAVKFTPSGGEVAVEARREAAWLVVTVRDTGPGIAPADQAAIFEEFRQLAASGEAKHEGTGLGLALARRLVELHGGRIEVESAPGQGSAFTAYWPAQVAHA